MAKVAIHPAVDHGVHIHAQAGIKGGTLVCACKTDPVEVQVDNEYLFNHLCGCTQRWKPPRATFPILAAVPREKVKVTKNRRKLTIVNESEALHRYACKEYGVHMYGVIDNPDHVFHPFAFTHPERSRDQGYARPTFAAFVSSAIEGRVPRADIGCLRARLKEPEIEPYECYSPELMDIVATHASKLES